VRNDDDEPATLGAHGEVVAEVAPGGVAELCGDEDGRNVERLQVGGRPFSGGWLIVDPDA
jgi:hypothetical protein